MTPKLIDVHTHTQFAAYKSDKDAVIKRALEKGIWMVNVGTQKDTSALAVETAKEYQEGVFAAVGLHPIHTERSFHDTKELGGSPSTSSGFSSREETFDYDYYKKLAQNPKVVAIGECGLDYYRLTEETKEKQAEVFVKQIELAKDVGKPLMIHCREAFHDLIPILREHLGRTTPPTPLLQKEGGEGGRLNSPGVVHFFSGTMDDAAHLMDLGFSFSLGGVITFARAYEKIVKGLPLDRILLETDAPYVTPQVYRGQRNEPAYVEEVAKKIAKILGKNFDEVAEITTQNTRKIFGI